MRLMIPSSTPKLAGRSNWGAVVLMCHACFSYTYVNVCRNSKTYRPLLPFPPLPDEPSDLLDDPFPFPVGTSGSVTGIVGVSDAISEGTELVDGSELGTKEGSSLGISEGSSLGPLLGISLGPVDGALEGSMLVVGAEVAGEGTFVGSSLGRFDGSLLGSSEGSMLGDDEGMLDGLLLVLGLSEGSLLGFVLGLSEGSLLGVDEGMLDGLLLVLGPSEGFLLGNDEGVSDGVSDGSSDGSSELSVLGIETGAAVPAGQLPWLQKQAELTVVEAQEPPLLSQQNWLESQKSVPLLPH